MKAVVNKTELFEKILNSAPASIHVLEINEQLEASVYWANQNYESQTDIDLQERGEIGFLDQSKVFNPEDAKEIKAAFSRFVKGETNEESIIARFNTGFKIEKWCYIRSVRVDLVPDKVHIISILFIIEDGLVVNPEKLDHYISENKRLRNQLKLSKLTKTELHVFELLGSGLSTKQAANQLCRSFDTVNNHRRSIFKKLDFHKISELVTFAKENGYA